jgi:DNA-binding NtrC family response regulator
MTQPPTLTSDDALHSQHLEKAVPESLALAIVWSPGESGRVGEVCIVPPTGENTAFFLGRGPAASSDPGPRLDFARNRAGIVEPRPPLASPKISRIQLRIESDGVESLSVESLGRCPLVHNGRAVESAVVVPGDTLALGRELLLLCLRRGAWVHSMDGESLHAPFGGADRHGLVGESPAAWDLRRRIAFIAPRSDHVLIVGESGTGKELVAQAIHAGSSRKQAAFVARNAATFPDGLVDAELFGHARNYPNAGMPERQGLVGEAAGATLFLDEIAELSQAMQTHLLRVLDGGEYQQLGDSKLRVSDFRLIAATNSPGRLREDFAARLKLSLETPTLNERPEDVPLLAVHLLRRIAASNPDVGKRLFPGGNLEAEPSIAIGFIDSLVRRQYRTNVRELEALLWEALREGPERTLDVPQPARSQESARPSRPARSKPPSAGGLEEALIENDWNLEQTWRALGLSSRHALARLMAKHGLRRPKSQE